MVRMSNNSNILIPTLTIYIGINCYGYIVLVIVLVVTKLLTPVARSAGNFATKAMLFWHESFCGSEAFGTSLFAKQKPRAFLPKIWHESLQKTQVKP